MVATLVKWKLRQIMAERKIGNVELANRLDVHPNTISRWKLSDELPKIGGPEIDKICKTLNCSAGQLLGIEPIDD